MKEIPNYYDLVEAYRFFDKDNKYYFNTFVKFATEGQ